MAEEIPQELLDMVAEEEAQVGPQTQVNPALVNLMRTLVSATLDKAEQTTVEVCLVIYQVVKSTLRHRTLRHTNTSMAELIFVYYFKVYQQYILEDLKQEKLPGEVLNEAALSVFNIYVQKPDDQTIRRMLILSANALRETITERLAQDKGIDFKTRLGQLHNLTLFTESLKDYIRTSNRKKNLLYVAWLRIVLEKVVESEDVAFLTSDEDIKAVLQQLIERKKVITITM